MVSDQGQTLIKDNFIDHIKENKMIKKKTEKE